jgi:hypothetical protein
MNEQPNASIPRSVLQAFYQHLSNHPLELKNTDAASVLELLYTEYTEIRGRDPEEIQQDYEALNDYLEPLSLDDNNAIFSLVVRLCCAYEQTAFLDGIKIGAHLMQEIQSG